MGGLSLPKLGASGFAHAVAVVMATRAYREGKKMFWDRKSEQILDHPVA